MDRSAALSHYSAHSAETERTTSHQRDDLKTTNVTADVPTTRAGSAEDADKPHLTGGSPTSAQTPVLLGSVMSNL